MWYVEVKWGWVLRKSEVVEGVVCGSKVTLGIETDWVKSEVCMWKWSGVKMVNWSEVGQGVICRSECWYESEVDQCAVSKIKVGSKCWMKMKGVRVWHIEKKWGQSGEKKWGGSGCGMWKWSGVSLLKESEMVRVCSVRKWVGVRAFKESEVAPGVVFGSEVSQLGSEKEKRKFHFLVLF